MIDVVGSRSEDGMDATLTADAFLRLSRGAVGMIHLLLAHPHCNDGLTLPPDGGVTALLMALGTSDPSCAAADAHAGAATALLSASRAADARCEDAVPETGVSALMLACARGLPPVTARLLKYALCPSFSSLPTGLPTTRIC